MDAILLSAPRRPVIDCQVISAAYDDGPPERHCTDRIVVEENLFLALLIVAQRYMRHAELQFHLDLLRFRDERDPGARITVWGA